VITKEQRVEKAKAFISRMETFSFLSSHGDTIKKCMIEMLKALLAAGYTFYDRFDAVGMITPPPSFVARDPKSPSAEAYICLECGFSIVLKDDKDGVKTRFVLSFDNFNRMSFETYSGGITNNKECLEAFKEIFIDKTRLPGYIRKKKGGCGIVVNERKV